MALLRKGTIVKHDGPVHALSYALRNIQVQYIPPVTVGQNTFALPVGWKKPDMPPAAKFKYDYSLENQVVEQAQVKALSQSRKVTNEELQRPRLPQLDSTILTPMLISSAPLVPTPASTTAGTTTTSSSYSTRQSTINMSANALGEMSLRDFEGAGDPFEATSLQAINDMEVLQTVLLPHHHPTPPQPLTPPQQRGNPEPSGQPPAVGASFQGSGVAQSQPGVGQGGGAGITQPQSNVAAGTAFGVPPNSATPLVLPPLRPRPGRASSSEESVLLPPSMLAGPVGGAPQGALGPVPGVSLSQTTLLTSDIGVASLPTPPMGPPPPLHPKPRPLHHTGSAGAPPPTNTVGLPPGFPPQPLRGTLFHDGAVLLHEGLSPGVAAPPTTIYGRPGLGVPVLPPIGGAPRPPPYSGPSGVAPLPVVQPPPPHEFHLVDPRSSLMPEQRVELDALVAMGFPPPRVARALLRSGGDKSKALDILVQIGNLEEKGHYGDSAEQALISTQSEDEALNYLNKVDQYKSIGFPESMIHEAYTRADGNWDNTLDLLTQGGV